MQSEFEKYLKNSNHFRDALNSHRAATAQVIAAFLGLLVKDDHVSGPAVRQLLKRLEDRSGNGNVDEARRVLIAIRSWIAIGISVFAVALSVVFHLLK